MSHVCASPTASLRLVTFTNDFLEWSRRVPSLLATIASPSLDEAQTESTISSITAQVHRSICHARAGRSWLEPRTPDRASLVSIFIAFSFTRYRLQKATLCGLFTNGP
ncbi:hypothetical protein IGI04_014378 [Brassica rapa subsp. trilocularis]|uniref:Uncharacterized protein n=1 Tax=Brassica rapa subsp. trilocularis TaxID=1813537 RepID=A0ABQ7MQA0_BRACM|nr:hypothetical protein IGI04_014378 [Brassica rapa subsp. trilocularis]